MGVTPAMTGLSGLSGLVGGAAAPAWTPLSLGNNLLQYALDGGNAYETSTLGGFEVLRSLEPYGTYRQPRQGRCWLFDGTDDFGTVTDSSFLITGNLTISAWIFTTSNTLNQAIAWCGDASSDVYFGLTYGFTDNRLGLWHNGSSEVATSDALSLAGAWNHVAVVRSGTSGSWTISFYVNGVLSGSSVVTTNPSGTTSRPFAVGRLATSASLHFNGRMRSVRVYNVAKDLTAISAIFAGNEDTSGLQAHYLCNEESGTVGYNVAGSSHLTLTNITQATFHATDTAVTRNANNSEGYRLSGSVFIPKRLADNLAADGNALTVTGRSPYPATVETPCITGDGTSVRADLGSVLLPATADFELSLLYFHTTNDTTIRSVVSQLTTGAPPGRFAIFANMNASYAATAGSACFYVQGSVDVNIALTGLAANSWHVVRLTRVGNVFTGEFYPVGSSVVSGSQTRSVSIDQSRNTYLLEYTSSLLSNGRIADLRITTGGVTTYFPLQDGPGSSNTNRDLSWIKSDGTYGVVSNAIVNGTVSTIWGNRCPVARDWCIEYGGRVNASGVFISGQISGSLCADGQPKTLVAGKLGNPFSRINFNPFSAAEANGMGWATAYAVTNARQTVAPNNTKFRRTKADGDDRFFATLAALTGTNLTNAEAYVA